MRDGHDAGMDIGGAEGRLVTGNDLQRRRDGDHFMLAGLGERLGEVADGRGIDIVRQGLLQAELEQRQLIFRLGREDVEVENRDARTVIGQDERRAALSPPRTGGRYEFPDGLGERVRIEHVVADGRGREDRRGELFDHGLAAAHGAGHGDALGADLEDILGRRILKDAGEFLQEGGLGHGWPPGSGWNGEGEWEGFIR